jgi:tetratricopeptide (TPR) repeat protein
MSHAVPYDPVATERMSDETDGCCCFICGIGSPPLIQSGCGCRGDAGLAHATCRVLAAESYLKQKAEYGKSVKLNPWVDCSTCEQRFTGEMQRTLGLEWWTRMRDKGDTHCQHRLSAAANWAICLFDHGRAVDADVMQQRVLGWLTQIPNGLLLHPRSGFASDVELRTFRWKLVKARAASLQKQSKLDEAESLLREVLGEMRRANTTRDESEPTVANDLATILLQKGDARGAETLFREVLRVIDEDSSRGTLSGKDIVSVKNNIAAALLEQGKTDEAGAIIREAIEASRRVFGPAHLLTMYSLVTFGKVLIEQKRFTEAEELCRDMLRHPMVLEEQRAGDRRQSGSNITELVDVMTSSLVEALFGQGGAKLQEGREIARSRFEMTQTLTDGTRVMVCRLVRRTELNGKRGRVLRFHTSNGRYAVRLDTGQDISLERKNARSLQCARGGCGNDAVNMCSRCSIVSYCSKDCQHRNWRVHKIDCKALPARRNMSNVAY